MVVVVVVAVAVVVVVVVCVNVTMSEPNWTFGQAVFYAATVLTTKGTYG